MKGRQFVTAEDLKAGPLLKAEAARKTVLTILRHFHRVKEDRGPSGGVVRILPVTGNIQH